ncbi:YtxH domain-containing protein [Anaerobacillus sp. MEB173]|uniref:YtxH domain-containing protein n=1 Tax=Anaerobacillus sp. MEB173 TaxID=3383345 RepID=UPI003F9046A9
MNGKSFLAGIITGSLIGGTIALLTSPKSGSDLQKTLKENGKQMKSTLTNVKNNSLQLKDQVKDTAKEGVTAVRTFSNEIKDSVQEWKSDVEPNVKNIYENITEIQNTILELEEKLANSK